MYIFGKTVHTPCMDDFIFMLKKLKYNASYPAVFASCGLLVMYLLSRVKVFSAVPFAEKVSAEIEKQLKVLPTAETARKSIDKNGLIILAESLEQAAAVANNKAPEHLELALDDGDARDKLLKLTHNYGTLFIGHAAAEVLGDYAGGLNHILPTSGAAKFTGGLSVRHFLKTVTTLRTEQNVDGSYKSGVAHSIDTAAILGDTEGLAGHAAAARIRNE